MYIKNPILKLYTFSLCFVNAFALNSILNLPLIISLIISALFFISIIKNRQLSFNKTDIVLYLFLLISFFSFVLNMSSFKSNKPINHLIAYAFTIVIFFFSVRHYFLLKVKTKNDLRGVLKFLTLGVLVSCIYGIFEFCFFNFFNFDIGSLIPRPVRPEYDALFMSLIFRIRSFMEESGHFSFYLEIFAPFVFYYLKIINARRFIFIPVIFIISLAFIFTFSSAGVFIYIVVLGVLFLKNIIKFIKRPMIIGLLTVFVIFSVSYFHENSEFSLEEIFISLTIDKLGNSNSSTDRQNRLSNVVKSMSEANIENLLFGFAPAAYDSLGFKSVVSLYGVFLLETGILGLIVFLLYYLVLLIQIFKIRDKLYKTVCIIGLFSVIVHYSLIGNYFFPWYWFLIALIQVKLKIENA